MGEDAVTLPDFTDPPVNETVLSIQFHPIPTFGVAHFGLYWPRIRSEFPRIQVVSAVPQAVEDFSGAKGGAQLSVQLLTQPEVRCWFMDHSGEKIIQVQSDRFSHNWRQIKGTERYPRYPVVRSTMLKHWGGFQEFLLVEKLELPQVNQCEVTYVNHIEYGHGWAGFGELSKVIAPWSGGRSGSFLPTPEGIGIEAHYRIPENQGRLHVQALPVVRGRDSKEVFQITLVARVAPTSQSTDDIFACLDLGREWVVKGFADFTAKEMQRTWGRQS